MAFSQLPKRFATHQRVLAFDWRGHGQSESPAGDFGANDLVEDALAVIEASGAQRVVPVTLAHAGWIAIELRRRLAERIPQIVHIDWIVLPPPPQFLELVKGLEAPEQWQQARDQLFKIWLEGVDNPEVIRFIHEEMGSHSAEMWIRSGREIGSGYAQAGSPLQALSTIDPPVPVLHLYTQPDDPEYLAAQESFAATHPWFSVRKLKAHSHFPTFEAPDEIEAAIEKFVAS
jgi:pimeloyl-ACP methyl ester carboxylesterase